MEFHQVRCLVRNLHLGSIFTSEALVRAAIDVVNERELDFVLMTGDVTEGMSSGNHTITPIGGIMTEGVAISL